MRRRRSRGWIRDGQRGGGLVVTIEEKDKTLRVREESSRVMKADEETEDWMISIQSKCLLLTSKDFKMIQEEVK